jgi:integrase
VAGDRPWLAETTVVRYVKLPRSFLGQRRAGRGGLESLSGVDVVAFLLAESERLSTGSVKGRVGEMHSLLRFLYLQGLTPRPLAAVVPPVAGWRDTGVPKAIPAGDVQRLLDSCDRADPIGIRDYAILILVARLGLRSAEVARLELGDIDWRAGQIILRGKAGRQDGMPLPCDVGEALARLPVAGAPGGAAAAGVRGRQSADAGDPAGPGQRRHPPGLRPCRAAPHRRPPAAAHAGDRNAAPGANIVEVSQVLRHRDLATTAIYAKVDFAAPRTVAQPWPEAEAAGASRLDVAVPVRLTPEVQADEHRVLGAEGTHRGVAHNARLAPQVFQVGKRGMAGEVKGHLVDRTAHVSCPGSRESHRLPAFLGLAPLGEEEQAQLHRRPAREAGEVGLY